jgi:hypothetical protein
VNASYRMLRVVAVALLATLLPLAVAGQQTSDRSPNPPPVPADTAGGKDQNKPTETPPGSAAGHVARPNTGQVETSVFGSHGIGSKFVYLFDRSNSMNEFEGRPLAGAKRELIASLADLDRIHQFQIVFYNERPTVFNPDYPRGPRMLFGDAATKRRATEFVRRMDAGGGTRHMEALKLALGMRPDVIFLVTDAGEPQLTAKDLADILRRNERVGAAINAIEFGVGPDPGGTNFLVRLAEQNHGQHVYVDVTRLPLD